MILLAAGVALAVGAGVTGVWWRRRGQSERLAAAAPSPPVEPAVARDALRGLPCRLGDVVMTRAGSEAWIVGAVVLHEDGPSAVLYRAPEAGGDRFVYARLDRALPWWWLSTTATTLAFPTAAFPRTLEHDATLLERGRSLAFRAEPVGELPWAVDDVVVAAEYEAPSGERLLVLRGVGTGIALVGVELAPGAYDIVASGERSLDAD